MNLFQYSNYVYKTELFSVCVGNIKSFVHEYGTLPLHTDLLFTFSCVRKLITDGRSVQVGVVYLCPSNMRGTTKTVWDD